MTHLRAPVECRNEPAADSECRPVSTRRPGLEWLGGGDADGRSRPASLGRAVRGERPAAAEFGCAARCFRAPRGRVPGRRAGAGPGLRAGDLGGVVGVARAARAGPGRLAGGDRPGAGPGPARRGGRAVPLRRRRSRPRAAGRATRRRHRLLQVPRPPPRPGHRRTAGAGRLLAIAVLSEVGAGPGPFRPAPGELTAAFADLEPIAAGEADGQAWLLARACQSEPMVERR